MRRRTVDLWSPAIGAAGTVVAYGHWGRPVLVFPHEMGGAEDFESWGMVDDVADLIDGGRVKLYCVDSYDVQTWSNKGIPLEERARRHGAYESWIIDQVVPWIFSDCAGPADILTTGASMGAYHAANFALKRADLFPQALCMSGIYDLGSLYGWGDRGEAMYFNTPLSYLVNMHGDHLEWLRSRVFLLLVCGQGMWEDSTGALVSTKALGRLLGDKGIPYEVDLWGYDVRTIGHGGGDSLHTICHGLLSNNKEAGMDKHLIGLLLGTEEDWPAAFETLLRRLGPVKDSAGHEHTYDVERITIEPFDLRDKPRYELVIDRLAYWYYHPREWLKKIALMDDVYLMNSPFTFQSMEKHAAYCAMIRLGLKVPDTVLVPYKNPPDHAKWAYTASRYNQQFDLDAIAERMGYPLFMKPYDGGAWVGVTRIRNRDELHAAYDTSGQRLMHLQKSVEGYDVFARSLSIGAETLVMKFRPELPTHERYEVVHGFLTPTVGHEAVTISRLVNAFFRWELNSCEMLVHGSELYPIDYANACPDVAITSLHYYFPWAMKTLLKWAVFCTVTGRLPRYDLDTRRYFDIADRADLSYEDKLELYRQLADEYFETDRYLDFCASRLSHLDEITFDWVNSPDLDRLLVDTVRSTYPPEEHDQFIEHFRGLIDLWIRDEGAVPVSAQ